MSGKIDVSNLLFPIFALTFIDPKLAFFQRGRAYIDFDLLFGIGRKCQGELP